MTAKVVLLQMAIKLGKLEKGEKIPDVVLEGLRPCTISCFALAHFIATV